MTDIYVMAVPWDQQRARRAAQLRNYLDATVVWDQRRNAMHTFQLALEAMGSAPALLMQDDILLADSFADRYQAIVDERPDTVIQFFSMRHEITESQLRPGNTFISNLCVYLPAGYALQLLEYVPEFLERYPQYATADDFVIRYWLHSRRENFWMQVPSLVQHERWVSAINERRPRNRVAPYFGGVSNV